MICLPPSRLPCDLGEVALAGLCRMVGRFFALVLLLPAGILFLAYLAYIAVMVFWELRKNK